MCGWERISSRISSKCMLGTYTRPLSRSCHAGIIEFLTILGTLVP